MKILQNESVKSHTTFGVEAKAKTFIEYNSEKELMELIKEGKTSGDNVLNIGGGSNLLFVNDTYDGTLLHSAIMGIEKTAFNDEEVFVKAGAGETWDNFVAECVKQGWYGAENLSLIPGSVGASPVQNIGAYGVEAKDIIESVECIDRLTGKRFTLTNEECTFGYRDSIFKHGVEINGKKMSPIVVRVNYRLWKKPHYKLGYGTIQKELGDEEPTLKSIRETIIKIRENKLPDPKIKGNGGSFFKNPVVSKEKAESIMKEYTAMPHYEQADGVKIPAAWLIEQSGWKGKELGEAGVDATQPLVLVNIRGKATGKDIVKLSDAVREAVKDKFGIEINPEVIFI